MVMNDKLIPKMDEVEIRHYGRHPGVDKFFTKWLGRGKVYESAWTVTAYLRKWLPAFERWTRGDCRFLATYQNGITNAGKAASAGLVGNSGGITAFTALAYGSSSTAFSASQTALVNEGNRASATVSRTTTSVSNDTLKLVKAFSITSTETAAEGGIFNNASSGGTMLARVVFSPSRSMGSGDTLTYTHKVQFA
jgi:hypothetical protein